VLISFIYAPCLMVVMILRVFNIDIFKDYHFDDNEVIHLCQFKNKKYGWLEE